MTKKQNEDAFSETVYAILILAVTVVLASLFASSVFTTWELPLQHTKIIATSIDQSGEDIRVHYFGGLNDPDLEYLAITAPNGTMFITENYTGYLAVNGTPAKPCIRSIMTLSGSGTTELDRVVVIGHFRDNTAQVVLESFI